MSDISLPVHYDTRMKMMEVKSPCNEPALTNSCNNFLVHVKVSKLSLTIHIYFIVIFLSFNIYCNSFNQAHKMDVDTNMKDRGRKLRTLNRFGNKFQDVFMYNIFGINKI